MAILIPAGASGPLPFPARRTWADFACARWLMLVCYLCLALSCLAGGADAPPAPPGNVERNVKAAFLYKFLGYVEFGNGQDAGPLTVGVLGADDVAAELARITTGRLVGTRAVVVRPLREGEPLTGLHMVFIDGDAPKPQAVLRAAQQGGVLSVTDSDEGLELGSVINFRVVEDRVRFEVSIPAAEKSHLKLSSRLLAVAYHVRKGGS
ncbi:hypothetical protein ASC94_27845 [Massilia sp. Root418]|jgi:hypothetical protein|uniref:YfiR family protein n=1 Tax=Massilia sp. Root418 TaxID=1736532 RepID=UPI0006F8F039|nr:YfiR family protein [Massilia sp. Root418]KQW87221.1 hypothetical protein ASC94_27845 [Massilia sp. Root418]